MLFINYIYAFEAQTNKCSKFSNILLNTLSLNELSYPPKYSWGGGFMKHPVIYETN